MLLIGGAKMLRLFEICFWVGVLFTFVTFILGQFFDIADIDGDFDFEGDTDFDADVPGYAISPLKPIVITAFITVFGGVGMMVTKSGTDKALAALIAIVSAFIISGSLYKFVVVPIYKAQNTSAIPQSELIGVVGKATINISANSFGHIIYSAGDNTYSAPAKALSDEIIEKGEEVIIKKIEKEIFYVERKQKVEESNHV